MGKKSSSRSGSSNRPTFDFRDKVEVHGDFVGGDQYKNISGDQIQKIGSADEFMAALKALQAQIEEIKDKANLTSAQKSDLQAVEEKVAEAAQTASQPEPDANEVQGALQEAKETMDTLAGSIGSAINLGTMLGNLAMMAIKIFGT